MDLTQETQRNIMYVTILHPLVLKKTLFSYIIV